MKLALGDGVPERFWELPRRAQHEAQRKLELVLGQPRMYPVRSRGVLRGRRCFYIEPYLFYYSVITTEIRLNAILLRSLRRA